jgi:DnaJ-class molecular chaperone
MSDCPFCDSDDCPKCNPEGWDRFEDDDLPKEPYAEQDFTCPFCQGTGDEYGTPCDHCDGEGSEYWR